MTTATTNVVKEDLTTPADPFDFGSGRVQDNFAGNPGLTFDETAARMVAIGNNPIQAVNLNLPSVNAPVMPGRLTTTRTAKNVTNQSQTYRVQTTAPAGASITVTPSVFTVGAGQSVQLTVTIRSNAPTAQYFGQIRLVPNRSSLPTLHLPVAFITRQGSVTVSQTCDPTDINLITISTCTVSAQNQTFEDTTANFATTTSLNLPVVGATNATIKNLFRVEKNGVSLAGATPGNPSLVRNPADVFGYIPLDIFGVAPISIGDEQSLAFNVPPYVYNGVTYSQLSVISDGYLVPGVATSEDIQFEPTGIPNSARPNNEIAPFWTDLNGAGAPGVFIATLTDGVDTWIVVEWRLVEFGTTNLHKFQTWLGVNGTQDIQIAYDPATLTAPSIPFLVGAENLIGSAGDSLGPNTLPTSDLRVTSTDPVPGATVSYTVTVLGILPGVGHVTTSVDTPAVPGTTIVSSDITVHKKFNFGGNFN
jgi:hypothetical protein